MNSNEWSELIKNRAKNKLASAIGEGTMPAKSKKQQKFMGMVKVAKEGKMVDASKAVKRAAKGMSMKSVDDFAATKHKGLPETVKPKVKKINKTESMADYVKRMNKRSKIK